jgi:hypothetical protein
MSILGTWVKYVSKTQNRKKRENIWAPKTKKENRWEVRNKKEHEQNTEIFFHLHVRCNAPPKPKLHVRCKTPPKPRFNLKYVYFRNMSEVRVWNAKQKKEKTDEHRRGKTKSKKEMGERSETKKSTGKIKKQNWKSSPW